MPLLAHQQCQPVIKAFSLMKELSGLCIVLHCDEKSGFVSGVTSRLNISFFLKNIASNALHSVRMLKTRKPYLTFNNLFATYTN